MNDIIVGDIRSSEVMDSIPQEGVQTIVTSPPYWQLRDYEAEGQLGEEKTPEEFVSTLVRIFSELKSKLHSTGTLWLNLGDTYRDKQLLGIPWRVALALQEDGWWLRSEVIWHKASTMPENVKDRPTRDHEHIFLLSKSPDYFYDADAVRVKPSEKTKPTLYTQGKSTQQRAALGHPSRYGKGSPRGYSLRTLPPPEGGSNRRTVWKINPCFYKGVHKAVFPPEIPRICILASTRPGDLVLDPFAGSGTTLLRAALADRRYLGVELNPQYAEAARQRISDSGADLHEVADYFMYDFEDEPHA